MGALDERFAPRDLDEFRAGRAVIDDVRAERLTLADTLRVYPATWLAPALTAYLAVLAVVAVVHGWREDWTSAAIAVPVVVAEVVLFCAAFLDTRARRTQAVLRRAARGGRRTWVAADGDRVRVYVVAAERRAAGDVLPRSRLRLDVTGAREFHAEEQADEAHAYVAEVEADAGHVTATALARALNSPRA